MQEASAWTRIAVVSDRREGETHSCSQVMSSGRGWRNSVNSDLVYDIYKIGCGHQQMHAICIACTICAECGEAPYQTFSSCTPRLGTHTQTDSAVSYTTKPLSLWLGCCCGTRRNPAPEHSWDFNIWVGADLSGRSKRPAGTPACLGQRNFSSCSMALACHTKAADTDGFYNLWLGTQIGGPATGTGGAVIQRSAHQDDPSTCSAV